VKITSDETKRIWKSGDYIGPDNRPYSRVTIQRMHVQHVDYWMPRSTWVGWRHNGVYRSALFGQDQVPRELRNIKSISYERSTDQDAATCTITLYNTVVQRAGEVAANEQDFDRPGWFTPNRGNEEDEFFINRWGYESNRWHNWLLPDRLIRTYEGYGTEHHLPPEQDSHMYPSGVWLIDKVSLNNAGDVVLECRDMAKLLLEQILYPPIVPRGVYPLWWEKGRQADDQPEHVIDDEFRPPYDSNSNAFYYGEDVHEDQEVNTPDGNTHAHEGADAFDDNITTWWLSNGQKFHGFAWVQGKMPGGQTVKSYKLNVRGGPYRVYVSLYNGSQWMGNHVIPYSRDEGEVDIEARIKYVDDFSIGSNDFTTRVLPKTYTGITRVRFTFTHLWDSGIGTKYPFRVAVQEIIVGHTTTLTEAGFTHYEGNYNDYTDIVKWLCAWGGLYWPKVGSGLSWVKYPGDDPETKHFVFQNKEDPVLIKGRVWGDFMQTGTSGVDKLTVETFDKKPVMDGINAIREIIGFEFWVDETGGAVWRLANMYKKGNYLQPPLGEGRSTRTTDVVVIDENDTLMDIQVQLDSKNVRERVFVANVGGNFGYTVKGFNPAPSGLMRVGGWTDQHFKNTRECQRMAEMIALRQAMTYRVAKITIPGNPAIQIDDQIRVYERNTGEGYLHRITGISSNYSNEEGSWTYELTTHWLGDAPFTNWAFDPEGLSDVTKAYLRAAGAID
jgi:hypothetical protein